AAGAVPAPGAVHRDCLARMVIRRAYTRCIFREGTCPLLYCSIVPPLDGVGTHSSRRAQFRHLEPCVAIAWPAPVIRRAYTRSIFREGGADRWGVGLMCRCCVGRE